MMSEHIMYSNHPLIDEPEILLATAREILDLFANGVGKYGHPELGMDRTLCDLEDLCVIDYNIVDELDVELDMDQLRNGEINVEQFLEMVVGELA